MSKLPYLPLFMGDFLAATCTWRGEQRALYLLLLGYQWVSGPLPADLDELADALAYDRKLFAKLWSRVGSKFELTPSGWLNLRLEGHREKANQISLQRSVAGAKGGRPRKQNVVQLPKQDESNKKPNALSLLKQSENGAVKHPIQPKVGEEAYQEGRA